jgi:hypothetical protein
MLSVQIIAIVYNGVGARGKKPKVANMFRRGNRNIIKEDRGAGPTTEREGHVGTLGSIHLVTPCRHQLWIL